MQAEPHRLAVDPLPSGRIGHMACGSGIPDRTWFRPWLRSLVVLLLLLVAGGCSLPVRQPAVPRAETEQASVLGGIPNARFWADTQVPELAEALRAIERERGYFVVLTRPG